MSITTYLRAFALLGLAASHLPAVSAHSWIEEYQVIDSNGSYIGDRGYSRGYMARTDPGYNGFTMDYLVPQAGVRINSSDSLCHPSQRTSNYSNPAYPKLKVAPGSYVAMKYLENGHVTLPWNQEGKPKAAGTVFVYGTTQPADDEKMADVLSWTADGKGGNGKGWLMTAQNFDDGRCHQINCGNISIERQEMFPSHVFDQPTSSVEQWCETDLKIPHSQSAGSLTTYWVWQWATAPNADCGAPEGKDEYYTTCADFDIIAPASGNNDAKIIAEVATNTLAQEAPQSTAVSDFKSRTAYTTSPIVIMIEGTSTSGSVTPVQSAFMSSCSALASQYANTTPPPKVDVPSICSPVTVFTGAAVASASASLAAYATTPSMSAEPVSATNSATIPGSGSSDVSPSGGPPTSTIMVTSTTTTAETTTMTLTMSSVTLQTTYVSNASLSGSSIAFPTRSTIGTSPSSPAAMSAPPSMPISSTPSLSTPTTTSASASTLSSAASSVPATVPPTFSPPSSSTPIDGPAGAGASFAATQGRSSPPSAPTVGSNGFIEDVVVLPTNGDRLANERIAQHRRRHARHFR